MSSASLNKTFPSSSFPVFPSDTVISMGMPDWASILTAEIWATVTILEHSIVFERMSVLLLNFNCYLIIYFAQVLTLRVIIRTTWPLCIIMCYTHSFKNKRSLLTLFVSILSLLCLITLLILNALLFYLTFHINTFLWHPIANALIIIIIIINYLFFKHE